jgi:hypothetical protein
MGELMERSSSPAFRGRLATHMLLAGILLVTYPGLALMSAFHDTAAASDMLLQMGAWHTAPRLPHR